MNKKTLWICACAILLAAVINLFFIINAYIPSSSMSPTIDEGCFVIGNRLAYTKNGPESGDIVLFKNTEVSDSILIKRVIALPGQSFSMKNGRVYINGEALDEPYIDVFSDDNYDEVVVPEDSYILLGDNRKESTDSRHWDDPYVTKDQIKAKATLMWFPKFKVIDTE